MKLSKNQIGEYLARDFYGEDYWKKMKRELDEMLEYRNKIKGRPTEEQMFMIQNNKPMIEMLRAMLFSHHVMNSGMIRTEFKGAQ